jgi:hypothetical protein
LLNWEIVPDGMTMAVMTMAETINDLKNHPKTT